MNFMFDDPIRLIPRINSFSKLVQYSIHVFPPQTTPLHPMQYIHVTNDYYLFCLEDGSQYITVPWLGVNDTFFKAYGYEEVKSCQVTEAGQKFLDKFSVQTSMLWEQAMLQRWTCAFEKCYNTTQLRDPKIGSVEIHEPVKIHDVTFNPYVFQKKTLHFNGMKSQSVTCYGMVSCYPNLMGMDNCGTFIFGKTFLLVCDEYGRTFLILQTEDMISLSPIVDRLLQANYTLTKNPDHYVTIHS